ncbi:MAG: hypothetical protein JO163_10205 [Methylobacteriaceae bacterium]|nr:hypothetical protein [Methylobacteriaceae bacterium]MBV9703091.1 hypothetical protein [Methylobacteriaceae bacterium]
MKYADGQKVTVGDEVSLGGGWDGVVVASIDDDEYTGTDPKEVWSYLEKGIVVKSRQAGYIYFPELDTELALLSRRQRSESR